MDKRPYIKSKKELAARMGTGKHPAHRQWIQNLVASGEVPVLHYLNIEIERWNELRNFSPFQAEIVSKCFLPEEYPDELYGPIPTNNLPFFERRPAFDGNLDFDGSIDFT